MKLLIVLILLSGCSSNIYEVNKRINKNAYIPGKYDCRHFANDKYKELIKDGYKSEEIKFVITDYKKEPHVVLNINGLILDNNSDVYPETNELKGGMPYEIWPYKNL